MTEWPTADMSMICPTCSTLNRTDAHFCATCGTPFDNQWTARADAFFNDEPPPEPSAPPDTAETVPAEPDTTLACASCGAHNDPAAPFCGSCGIELPVAGVAADEPPLGELLGPHAARIPVRGVMSIGRDPRNSITIRDASISRVHARLDCRSGIVLLSDLQSTNGTWVNGQRVDHEELSDGDRLLVGRTEFVFRSTQRTPRNAGGAARGNVLGSVEEWLAPEASDAEAFPGAGTEPVYDDPWAAPAPHAADPWTSVAQVDAASTTPSRLDAASTTPSRLDAASTTPSRLDAATEAPSQVDAAWAALGVPVSPPSPDAPPEPSGPGDDVEPSSD